MAEYNRYDLISFNLFQVGRLFGLKFYSGRNSRLFIINNQDLTLCPILCPPEVSEYIPTLMEGMITLGLYALGFFVLTTLFKIAVSVKEEVRA